MQDFQPLLDARDLILKAVTAHYRATGANIKSEKDLPKSEDWPDTGLVRRERYPWNDIEPDRFSPESIEHVNAEMTKVAPKLEVRATELPNLTSSGDKTQTVMQLGVFAKEDIEPGEVVLRETSLLTANNRLQDALCDACSADLPDLRSTSTIASSPDSDTPTVSCETCAAVFCSASCYSAAMASYHPALCDMDVDSIARDVPPARAADSLYLLLLLRALAMAETQDVHPLTPNEVKYIWADYSVADLDRDWRASVPGPSETARNAGVSQRDGDAPVDFFCNMPRTLPFSFDSNVVLPLHMLTKMDVDVFAQHARYDGWVFNTLYAKFRGTASARLSGLRDDKGTGIGRVRGPEVSAVHPNWCLANHSCDPNVRWEWGGEVRFWARGKRVRWRRGTGSEGGREDGKEAGKGEGREGRSTAGIKKGEEVLNHYCDIDLPVKARREWAAGSLGGPCMCDRCRWEAGEVE